MRMRTGNLRLRPAMQKKLLRHLPYILIQCTWGIIQTIAGFVMFLISTGSNHAWYNGAVATFWNKPFGISLGLFIFIPPKARFYNSEKYNFSDEKHCRTSVSTISESLSFLCLQFFNNNSNFIFTCPI